MLGGGFGRRDEDDVVFQAATLAKAMRRPVQVVWSREEDLQHDFYRPLEVARLTAGLDGAGMSVFSATGKRIRSLPLTDHGFIV